MRPTLEPWVGHALTSGLTRVIPEREPLTAEEAKRIEMAEADIDELAPILEDDDATPEARSGADEAIQALEAQIAALRDKPAILDEALKPRLGAFLLLDHHGVPTLDSVFYAEGPLEPDSATDEESGWPSVDGDDEGAPPVQASDKPKPLSRALVDELAIQRRDILAVHVAADPDLALDLAIFLMVERDAAHSGERTGSSLLALVPSDPVFGFKTPEAKATIARAIAADELDRSWTPARNGPCSRSSRTPT